MKNLFLVIVFLLTFSVAAQTKNESETIDVSGSAEVKIAPDEVVFSLDVTNIDNDLFVAKKQNDETVAKVLAISRTFAIDSRDVRTDYISVEKKFLFVREKDKRIYDEDGDEVGEKTFKGFEVTKTVIIRLRDLSKFEALFSELIKSGVTEITSVRFETSKIRAARDQARELAMKAAYEKAKAMAGAVGQSIGRAISIIEVEPSSGSYSGGSLNSNSNMPFQLIEELPVKSTKSVVESIATFSPGSISVTANVKVRFLLN